MELIILVDGFDVGDDRSRRVKGYLIVLALLEDVCVI